MSTILDEVGWKLSKGQQIFREPTVSALLKVAMGTRNELKRVTNALIAALPQNLTYVDNEEVIAYFSNEIKQLRSKRDILRTALLAIRNTPELSASTANQFREIAAAALKEAEG